MGRSKWKGFFLSNSLYSSLVNRNTISETIGRQNVLIKDFENLLVKISNGKSKVSIIIGESMLGFRVKDFVLTRKFLDKRKK